MSLAAQKLLKGVSLGKTKLVTDGRLKRYQEMKNNENDNYVGNSIVMT